MGIGTYESREYVRELGGQMDVESTPGTNEVRHFAASGGAEIEFDQRPSHTRRCRVSKNSKPNLLVVEDDPGLQKQMRWGFDDYEVVVANDCESAVAQMRRFEPAVMTLDLGLPPDPDGVSQGFETLSKALELFPDTKVIVTTGNQDRNHAVKAIGMGAYDFYQKPVRSRHARAHHRTCVQAASASDGEQAPAGVVGFAVAWRDHRRCVDAACRTNGGEAGTLGCNRAVARRERHR